MGIRNCIKPPWVSVWVCELIISVINKSNTWLLYISTDFNFCSKKSNNHLGTCQFFACSFMNPGGSLRVLVSRTGCSLILVIFQILKLGWFFNSIVFQNTQIKWFFGSHFFKYTELLCGYVVLFFPNMRNWWFFDPDPAPRHRFNSVDQEMLSFSYPS
jgi:hypothetical protein